MADEGRNRQADGNTVHRPPNLPPPKCFDGTPANWPKWRQRFDRYRTASGLASRPRQEKESNMKEQQQAAFNKRHAAREAPPLRTGETVFIRDMNKTGQVMEEHPNPRSFIVKTAHGAIRRNRSDLVAMPGNSLQTPQEITTPASSPPSPPPPRPQQAASSKQEPPHQQAKPTSTFETAEPAVGTPGQVYTRSGRPINKPAKLNL